MKIIAITNQKGGCGKTTTAINLASSLALNAQKTLLIDLDPQAHATLGLNVDDTNSLYNCISRLTPHQLKIKDVIKPVDENFDIVPSNVLVGTLEQELADEIGRELKLSQVIHEIKDFYDYILIDCPPNLGFLTVNAIRASDELIIPVETSRFSVQGVDRLIDIAHLIQERLNHGVRLKVLITMFDSRLRHSFGMLDKMKEKFNGMLFDTIIHINVKLKEAAVMGEAVIKYDKYCRGSKDYMSLAREILFVPHEPSPRMKELVKKETREFLEVATAFCLKAPQAKSVYVSGSFNDWALDEACRMSDCEGVWTLKVNLKPGTYKYQFIIDGKWQQDPANKTTERNAFGDINSVIEVS